MTLIDVSLVAWLLLISGSITHNWLQIALFGLANGGGLFVHDRFLMIFGMTLLAVIAYTVLVWILSPIQSALAIEFGAAFALALLGSWLLMSKPQPILSRTLGSVQ